MEIYFINLNDTNIKVYMISKRLIEFLVLSIGKRMWLHLVEYNASLYYSLFAIAIIPQFIGTTHPLVLSDMNWGSELLNYISPNLNIYY